jgi:hypothetical protein
LSTGDLFEGRIIAGNLSNSSPWNAKDGDWKIAIAETDGSGSELCKMASFGNSNVNFWVLLSQNYL